MPRSNQLSVLENLLVQIVHLQVAPQPLSVRKAARSNVQSGVSIKFGYIITFLPHQFTFTLPSMYSLKLP